jgi:Asp-tRNA(Asn)/Glu-tRNA(Gln) amidotransferase A subunit family amidase/predicted amidohydrolase YtcJ
VTWVPSWSRTAASSRPETRRGSEPAGIPGVTEQHINDGWLIPAFGDGHAHPMFGGLEAEGPQVRRQSSVAEIVAEVGRWAADHPGEDWILGASYDSSLSPEGLFDARWLDEAVPDRPVALRAWDYHTMWVNTRALELAGITAQTPDPPLGEIPHRPDGSVLGTLREWGAVDLITAVADRWPLETCLRSLERAARAYAALGVTWVQDAWVEPDTVKVYCAAAQQDRLPIRFNLALYADPRHWPDQLDGFLEARRLVQDLGHPHLTANTVKFFADGVVENATGALLDHYCGCPGERGMLVWEPDLLARAVTEVDAAGFQPHIHTIGDRAVRVALDALEAAERANGPRDRRAVLAHVQLIDEADRDRFAALGAIANAEPLWSQLDALMNVLIVPRLGQERADTQYPWASLTARGIPMSFGSDWPVSSADPLQGMAVACSRQTDDLARALSSGEVTSEGLVQAYLARIEAFDRAGPRLNAVIVDNPEALAEALASDRRRACGESLGPLDGIPYTAKDSYSARGLTAAAGSPAFASLVAQRDSYAVSRLRGAGAILLGLTNMPPMANGGMQRGLYGRAESPYNPDYLTAAFASGSSNGSGTATAASFAAFGLAEETWSSGRAPASNNGLCAYTPSRGIISIRGNWPLVPTMDVVVPHTRSMDDLLTLLDILVAPDAEVRGDFWRVQPWVPIPPVSALRPSSYAALAVPDPGAAREVLRGRRFALPRMYVNLDEEAGTAPDGGIGGPTGQRIETRTSVVDLMHALVDELEAAGAQVILSDFPLVSNYERDRPSATSIRTRGLWLRHTSIAKSWTSPLGRGTTSSTPMATPR